MLAPGIHDPDIRRVGGEPARRYAHRGPALGERFRAIQRGSERLPALAVDESVEPPVPAHARQPFGKRRGLVEPRRNRHPARPVDIAPQHALAHRRQPFGKLPGVVVRQRDDRVAGAIEIPAPAAVAYHGQPFVIIPGPEVLRLNDQHAGVVN
ncbi:hypothetical protein RZS08_10135, partial [Arthrospira platensis SPKY1]|nr:hypothetical protein [Arthrospira platensis SPKY1]